MLTASSTFQPNLLQHFLWLSQSPKYTLDNLLPIYWLLGETKIHFTFQNMLYGIWEILSLT